MASEKKMSEVFELPLKYVSIDDIDYILDDGLREIEFSSKIELKAIVHAVNSHDDLVSKIEMLDRTNTDNYRTKIKLANDKIKLKAKLQASEQRLEVAKKFIEAISKDCFDKPTQFRATKVLTQIEEK